MFSQLNMEGMEDVPSKSLLSHDYQELHDIMTGRANLPKHNVNGLKTSLITSKEAGEEFSRIVLDFKNAFEIVGVAYRTPLARKVLSYKSISSTVLLVRTPGNQYDTNAVACFISGPTDLESVNTDANKDWAWLHVGYLPAPMAKKLSMVWPHDKQGIPEVVSATLMASSAERRSRGSVLLNYEQAIFPTRRLK